MRAVVFHGPGDLREERLPVPDPAPGEVVVRIEAALTCGTDVKTLRRGHPVMIPRVPTVFGHELAGAVSAVGAGVRSLREGDRVVAANSAPCGACRPCLGERPNLCEDLLFVNGAYGEYIALPPRLVARNVVVLGRGLDEQASAVRVLHHVRRRLAHHDAHPSGLHVVEAHPAREAHRLAPRFSGLRCLGDVDAPRARHFHRVMTTRVPFPGVESIANSSDSRRAPPRPRPRPPPVV